MAHRARRVEVWGSCGLLFFLGLMMAMRAGGQTLDVAQQLQVEHRFTTVETKMDDFTRRLDSMQSIGTSILLVVVGQLALNIFGMRKRNGER